MSKYKLHYLNGRARAEVSRLIFAVAGQKFEDIRYKDNEWPLHKANMPLGQVPVLEVDGVKLPQSLSISRFLAKQFQLAGKSNLGQAKTDAVVDTINEAFSKLKTAYIEPDAAKRQELMKKFFAEDSPSYLRYLEVLRKSYSNGGPFFVENNLTWADLSVHNALEYFLEVDRDCLNDFPWLKQNYEEVRKQPRIAEYLKNRPKEQF